MTAQSVAAQQDDIHYENDRSHADAEPIGKMKCFVRVVSKKGYEYQREIEKIPMDVLEDERKRFLASIFMPRLTDGTPGRICPERLVVSPAIVITGKSKSAGRPEDHESRRERYPARYPRGFITEQRGRGTQQLGRVER